MTKIVNIKTNPNYTLYIGRANKYYNKLESIFHNPFVIGKDGAREEVIKKFEEYAINNRELKDNLWRIDDETLGCYCNYPEEDCHGRILIELRGKQKSGLGLLSSPRTRCIIAGSRHIDNYKLVKHFIIQSKIKIDEIVCGEARGVDSCGKRYGIENNIPVTSFPAQWDKYGKSAGYRRNEEMAKYASHLILIWDSVSKGSGHMLDIARKYKLEIHNYTYQ